MDRIFGAELINSLNSPILKSPDYVIVLNDSATSLKFNVKLRKEQPFVTTIANGIIYFVKINGDKVGDNTREYQHLLDEIEYVDVGSDNLAKKLMLLKKIKFIGLLIPN